MGINATYTDKQHHIQGAYIKVERIWGSKQEGWNCWVGVYANESDRTSAVPVFSVNAPYVEDENPFKALYAAIEKLPNIITAGKIEEISAAMKPLSKEQPKKEEPLAKKTRKPRKKKAS